MRKILRFGFFAGLLSALLGTADSFAAKKQSALSGGTKVRAKIEATGIYDEECYNQYFGCMDQFCIADNENGGTCQCSDDAAKYEEQLEEIRKILVEAERISTEEVEKIQAGANADIIFNGGERIYNDDGSVVKAGITTKVPSLLLYDDEEEDEEDEMDLSGKNGKELYTAANQLCKEQMSDSCKKDMTMLTQMYSRQIVSDCKGLANSIALKKQEADSVLIQAKSAVRGALRESLEESNKYDRGTCLVEYKKCLNYTQAKQIVLQRHKELEQAKQENEKQKANNEQIQKLQSAVYEIVDDTLDKITTPEVIVQDDEILTVTFTIKDTREKIKSLKNFMIENGIKYERYLD